MESAADCGGSRDGRRAWIGLAGAVLAAVGDVLILGRPCSGSDFDRAAGLVLDDIEVDDRWRSLWNGAVLPAQRIRAGMFTGMFGIGLLGWFGLRGATQAVDPGVRRTVASGSAAAFTAAGILTHWSCGLVVLAYQKALQTAAESTVTPQTSPRSVTSVLGASAVGSLGALAVLSASLTATPPPGRRPGPTWRGAITPFACVASTLATFGFLPAPVGGYARPTSISAGLLLYMTFQCGMHPRQKVSTA